MRVIYRRRPRAPHGDGALLNARLVLATGPLAMAWSTGATVLPVFTLLKEPGRFEVTIGKPIVLMENADGEATTGQRCKPMPTGYSLRSFAILDNGAAGDMSASTQLSRAFRTNNAVSNSWV